MKFNHLKTALVVLTKCPHNRHFIVLKDIACLQNEY